MLPSLTWLLLSPCNVAAYSSRASFFVVKRHDVHYSAQFMQPIASANPLQCGFMLQMVAIHAANGHCQPLAVQRPAPHTCTLGSVLDGMPVNVPGASDIVSCMLKKQRRKVYASQKAACIKERFPD
eukprot:1158325-Pelagomonas_calceolata.AAC.9